MNIRKEIRSIIKEFYHPVVKYGDQEYANPFDIDKPLDKLSEEDIQRAIVGSKYIEVYNASFERFTKDNKAVYSVSFYHKKLDKMMDKIVYVSLRNGNVEAYFK